MNPKSISKHQTQKSSSCIYTQLVHLNVWLLFGLEVFIYSRLMFIFSDDRGREMYYKWFLSLLRETGHLYLVCSVSVNYKTNALRNFH